MRGGMHSTRNTAGVITCLDERSQPCAFSLGVCFVAALREERHVFLAFWEALKERSSVYVSLRCERAQHLSLRRACARASVIACAPVHTPRPRPAA